MAEVKIVVCSCKTVPGGAVEWCGVLWEGSGGAKSNMQTSSVLNFLGPQLSDSKLHIACIWYLHVIVIHTYK